MTTWDILVNEYKKRLLSEALMRNRGNQCAAARDLGIHRNTFARNAETVGMNIRSEREDINRSGVYSRFSRAKSRPERLNVIHHALEQV